MMGVPCLKTARTGEALLRRPCEILALGVPCCAADPLASHGDYAVAGAPSARRRPDILPRAKKPAQLAAMAPHQINRAV